MTAAAALRHAAVAQLMRAAAREIVLPRFRTLSHSDVFEKSKGELVTVADRETEAHLSAGLAAIDPGARIIGEEACEHDPGLLSDVDAGEIWIIDPIDGTANFAAGRAPFGLMIARVEDGLAAECWILDPITDRLCHASRDNGAYVNGIRAVVRGGDRPRPIASLATQFMGHDDRTAIDAVAARAFDLVPIPRCAAEHYPRLVLGENDIALFQRTLPWDHAAGALLLTEAGGRVTRWDGSDYRVGDGKLGLLAASTPALWGQAADLLLSGEAPLPLL